MRFLLLPFQPRFAVYTAVLLITAMLLLELSLWPSVYVVVPLVLFGSLAVLGTADLLQTRHAVLRNYPLSAHIRFILEEIRPEIRQYFLESEKTERRFRATSARSSISAPSRRSTSVRSGRKTRSIPAATSGCIIRSRPGYRPRSLSAFLRRSRLRKALLGFGIQYFRDEFRRFESERHSRAQYRREEG
jgi:hypothetical protein